MDILQLEQKLQTLVDTLNKNDFIFDFLLAYEMPKANVARLRKNSDVNTLESNGELSVKNKKLFFKEVPTHELESLFTQSLASTKSLRFLVMSDYITLKAFDTKLQTTLSILLCELPKNSDFFWPLAGVERAAVYDEKEADVKASIKMAKLYEELKKENPTNTDAEIHALNIFLTRLLFCYFAEDTEIFVEENQFTNYIKAVSKPDGSDLDVHINTLFETLNSEERNISSHLKSFPYVNGGLFRDNVPLPKFSAKSRRLLIECGAELNWSQINPDIFGSMIQAVVSEEHRGGMGMHYTSVPNIMKVINPLFLEELHEEYEAAKGNPKKLNQLHNRITNLKIFDPACGSGNFLIIAYKELRKLEMKIFESGGMLHMPSIKLSQFYGIELDDFAHEVAILSLWLTEHQMNMEFRKKFGDCTPTLPLKNGGHIRQGNAARLDWAEVCPKVEGDEIYVLGNPPYVGRRNQNKIQKQEIVDIFNAIKNHRSLDYISIWFYKGAEYIRNFNAELAFVSTNSIVQGELVALLWPSIFIKNIEINFAYQSFKWQNNAKANAGVTVIIIGLTNANTNEKSLYINNVKFSVKNINAYLVNAKNVFIENSSTPISNLPKMTYGNMPGGCTELFLLPEEKYILESKYPELKKYIKKLIGSQESIKSIEKYCLWFKDISINDPILNIEEIAKKLVVIKNIRENSKDISYNILSDRPHQFRDLKETITQSILIPIVSSENRKYIPISIVNNEYIIPNSAQVIYDTSIWIFGIVSSFMHIIWVRAVAGKLEERYRYSKNVVYNTFPFPKITETQKDEIEELVNLILDERDRNYLKTMAELYDPDKMPEGLKTAHHNLDIYIEKCYKETPFESDEERLEHLFKLYEKMIKEEKK